MEAWIRGGMAGRAGRAGMADGGETDPGAQARLWNVLGPLILRRTVESWDALPDKRKGRDGRGWRLERETLEGLSANMRRIRLGPSRRGRITTHSFSHREGRTGW
jgi:hypothetical protein